MGLPRIIYNSRNLDFPFDCYNLQPDFPRSVAANLSVSEVAEYLNAGPGGIYSYQFRLLENANSTHATLKRKLENWLEWAQQGKPWYFARDNSKTGLTTLSAGAAAGDTALTVTGISGFASGDDCILRSATQQAKGKINGAPSGSTVTLTESLDFDFTASCRFRHREYIPGRLLDYKIIIERAPLHFDVSLIFNEDMN